MEEKAKQVDYSILKSKPEIVSQLQLPRLQAILSEINGSEEPIEALEKALNQYPEFDQFLSKCLAAVKRE